jgi:hypothetical protein
MQKQYRTSNVLGYYVFLAVFVAGCTTMATPVMAATQKLASATTSCVTAATIHLHEAAMVQLNKDIAPYAENKEMQDAIKAYSSIVDISWTAMQDPYCGFGTYGAASGIHSFNKTVSQAREAFLNQAKGKKQNTVAVAAPTVAVSEPAVTTDQDEVAKIPQGLKMGVRSTVVTVLQEKLLKHFKLPLDADHVTGYFGRITKSLLIKFQYEHGIVTSDSDSWAGTVGPKTAAALNALK